MLSLSMSATMRNPMSCRRSVLACCPFWFVVLLSLLLLCHCSNGFLQIDHHHHYHYERSCSCCGGSTVRLFARGRKLKKAQKQKSGGSSGGGKQQQEHQHQQKVVGQVKRGKTVDSSSSTTGVSNSGVPRPTSTRRIILTLDRPSTTVVMPNLEQEEHQRKQEEENSSSSISLPHGRLRVCTIQIDDPSWWEHSQNTNPYGAKLWPSALGVSQFLVGLGPFDPSQSILELGCGCGLVSLVAAQNGASVVATDISNTALSLTRDGWKETKKLPNSSSSGGGGGSVSVQNFDLCSSQPLPLTVPQPREERLTATTSLLQDERVCSRPIVIAAAMMYEADLAEALARRAVEAVNLGAWVIVGDDDTGQRENGRQKFEAKLDQLLRQSWSKKNDNNNNNSSSSSSSTNNPVMTKTWTSTIVKNTALGWNEKRVKLLHLNAP